VARPFNSVALPSILSFTAVLPRVDLTAANPVGPLAAPAVPVPASTKKQNEYDDDIEKCGCAPGFFLLVFLTSTVSPLGGRCEGRMRLLERASWPRRELFPRTGSGLDVYARLLEKTK